MGHTFSHRAKGFTLLELILTGAIIGILATLVAINLSDQRKASRDANRQLTVTSYSTSLEQYYSQNKTYMVAPTPCDIKPSTSDTYPGNISFALPEGRGTACVGFMGAGWGSMHRKNNGNIINYGQTTIAEALRNLGFLAKISTDPRTNGEFPSQPASFFKNGNIGDFDDYILTLCDSDGKPATTVQQATEYAIYAQLERDPKVTMPNVGPASQSCGGPGTTYTWDTVQ